MKSIILTTIILCFGLFASAQDKEKDAICDIKVEGQEFALHLVEVGDNLFRIAQKYNSTVDDIWEVNPSLIDNTIIPGQVIKVPKNSKTKIAVQQIEIEKEKGTDIDKVPTTRASAAEIAAAKAEFKMVEPKLDPRKLIYHEVEKQQTLFSISRLYNVSIEDLQTWNKLDSYDISIGQKLIVNAHGELKLIDDQETVQSYTASPKPIKQAISVNAKQDVLYEEFLNGKASGMKLNKQRGTAGKLVSNNPNAKDAYYALHKTAPVGSIIKVMNLVNRKYVFVKVLAPLPDIDENANIEIKLSPAASKEIVLLDGKSLVEIAGYY